MIVGGIPMLFGGAPVEISLTANAVSAANLTTYTFAAQSLGVAAGDRLIAVGIGSAGNTTTISSVTIGGVSASQVVAADGGSGNSRIAAIWVAAVPTGATGNVVVTFGSGMVHCSIDVYRLVGASATTYHTATDITITSNAESASLNLVANGAAIGVFHTNGGATRTTTWTNLTEQTDRVVEAPYATSTAANATTETQALTITATASGSLDQAALALASFRPV
jgi:hypothetical protein